MCCCGLNIKTLIPGIIVLLCGIAAVTISALVLNNNLSTYKPETKYPIPELDTGLRVIFAAAIIGIIAGTIQMASIVLNCLGLGYIWSALSGVSSLGTLIAFIMPLCINEKVSSIYFHTISETRRKLSSDFNTYYNIAILFELIMICDFVITAVLSCLGLWGK